MIVIKEKNVNITEKVFLNLSRDEKQIKVKVPVKYNYKWLI